MRNDPEWKWRERIMPALEAFYRLHGHCRVPCSNAVPPHEDWPRLLWGLNLGTLVNRIRSLGKYSAQVRRDKARLEELDFVWDTYEFEWSERIMPALETFRRLNGHCLVPRKCAVPSHEDWPRLSWGLNLGVIVNSSSYFTQVTRSKARLAELDFVWNVLESEWRERILPALETFYRLHGHCRVPAAFGVPGEACWPEKLHGFKPGFAVKSTRSRGSYFDQIARTMDSLAAIEFDSMTAVTRNWEEREEPMLATFEQLHGHRNVPRDFVVPSSPPWEKKDWGYPARQARAERVTPSAGVTCHNIEPFEESID